MQAKFSTWESHTPHGFTLFSTRGAIPRACRLDSTFAGSFLIGQLCEVTGVNEEDQISTCLKVAAEDPSETYRKSEFLLFGKSRVARLSGITLTACILGFWMLWAIFCCG